MALQSSEEIVLVEPLHLLRRARRRRGGGDKRIEVSV